MKAFYLFVICDCLHSGIWFKDFEAAKLYSGFDITQEEFEEAFISKKKAFEVKQDVYFFPDFIEHQYPNGIQENNKAHKGIFNDFKKYNIDKGTLKPLGSPLEGSKVMVMVMDKVIKGGVGENKMPDPEIELLEPLKLADPSEVICKVDIEKEIISCKEETAFKENLQKRLSASETEILKWIEQFHLHIKATEEVPENRKRLRSYCTSWIAKHYKPAANETRKKESRFV
jgi:hypothetical protein